MRRDGSRDTGKINQTLPFQVSESDSRSPPPPPPPQTQGRAGGDVRSIRMLLRRDGLFFFFSFAGERKGEKGQVSGRRGVVTILA